MNDKKIEFKDLNTFLKVVVVGSCILITIYILSFLAGMLYSFGGG